MTQEEKSADKQAEKKVSFLNYNLYCLPWLAVMFAPSTCPYPSERSHHFLQTHLTSYDVLCLQEVWNPRFSTIERSAKSKGMHVVGSSQATMNRFIRLRVFGGGLMIISKYPIVETREKIYEQGTGSDAFVSKGVLYAKIDLGTTFVHVFNTHLQASYGCEYKKHDPYASIRKKQIKVIAKFVEETTKNDHYPIVLMGDFNVNARRGKEDDTDSDEYKEMVNILSGELHTVVDLLKESNENTHPVTHEGNGVFVGDRVSHGGQRLDFILEIKRKSTSRKDIRHKFTDNQVETFSVKDKIFNQCSDHYGVSTNMHLYTDTCPEYVVQKEGENFKLSHASIQISFEGEQEN